MRRRCGVGAGIKQKLNAGLDLTAQLRRIDSQFAARQLIALQWCNPTHGHTKKKIKKNKSIEGLSSLNYILGCCFYWDFIVFFSA